jgi:hypothetical protein
MYNRSDQTLPYHQVPFFLPSVDNVHQRLYIIQYSICTLSANTIISSSPAGEICVPLNHCIFCIFFYSIYKWCCSSWSSDFYLNFLVSWTYLLILFEFYFRVEDEKLVTTYISRFSLFTREIYGFEKRFSWKCRASARAWDEHVVT